MYPEIAVALGMVPEHIVSRCNGTRRIELLLGDFVHRSYAIYRTADRGLLETAVAPELAVLSELLSKARPDKAGFACALVTSQPPNVTVAQGREGRLEGGCERNIRRHIG